MAKLTRFKTDKPILITGGAGFIGTNLADRLALSGSDVLIYDNLSRAGVETNLDWLRKRHDKKVSFILGDIRDKKAIGDAVSSAGHIFHFAAQTAVTTSLTNPMDDFEANTVGTLNILEAVRSCSSPPTLTFTSTNKVYGKLRHISYVENETRYIPSDTNILYKGIAEDQPLDFYSPYGCSKGSADQYVLDYSRIYNLPTTVFRMSCIYGPHQFGTEDQGWVAHFTISCLSGSELTIFGNGKQVRDILFVDDLVDAFILAKDNFSRVKGKAFNVGGGPQNSISLIELINCLKDLSGGAIEISYDPKRPGDQEFYISDTTDLAKAIGWRPKTSVRAGIEYLYSWLKEYRFNEHSSVRAAL